MGDRKDACGKCSDRSGLAQNLRKCEFHEVYKDALNVITERRWFYFLVLPEV